MGDTDYLEQRRFYRVRCEMKVQCRPGETGGPTIEGKTDNLSRGGLRLHVREEVAIGKVLNLHLVNEPFDIKLDLTGVVAWREWQEKTKGYEIGIRFQNLTEEQQKNVIILIGRLAENHGGQRPGLI